MRVVELWRYPVKSTLGESLGRAEVDDHGLVGDRQWGLLDRASGKVLTARREPALLFAHSRLVADGPPVLTLDDGRVLDGDADLSGWLGRDVTLVRAEPDRHGSFEIAVDAEDEEAGPWVAWDGPDGSFHDSGAAQISLLSRERTRHWDLRRFRANIVIDRGDEQDLLGSRIDIGTVTAQVAMPIGRCVMTTRPQAGGVERDLDVLRTINRDHRGLLAVGAQVTRAGVIAVGDEISDAGGQPPVTTTD